MEWFRNIEYAGSVNFHWCVAINLRLITLPSAQSSGLISSFRSHLPSLISINNKYLFFLCLPGYTCMPVGEGTLACFAQCLTHQALLGVLMGLGIKDGAGFQRLSWKKGPESPGLGHQPVVPGLNFRCSRLPCQCAQRGNCCPSEVAVFALRIKPPLLKPPTKVLTASFMCSWRFKGSYVIGTVPRARI